MSLLFVQSIHLLSSSTIQRKEAQQNWQMTDCPFCWQLPLGETWFILINERSVLVGSLVIATEELWSVIEWVSQSSVAGINDWLDSSPSLRDSVIPNYWLIHPKSDNDQWHPDEYIFLVINNYRELWRGPCFSPRQSTRYSFTTNLSHNK